jgi:hypothetical protein
VFDLDQPMPRAAAYTAAWTRELRLSLRRMCWTWIFTVVSAMSRSRAMTLLLAPREISVRISRSRADRISSPSPGDGGRFPRRSR